MSTTSGGPWRIGIADEHVVPSRTFFSVGSAYLQALWQREREPLTVIASTYVGSKVQLEPSPIVRPPSATYSHAVSPRFLTGRSLSNQELNRRYAIERYHLSTTMLSYCGAVYVAPPRPWAQADRKVRPIPRPFALDSTFRFIPSRCTFRKMAGFERLQEPRRRSVGNRAHGAPVRERSQCHSTVPDELTLSVK